MRLSDTTRAFSTYIRGLDNTVLKTATTRETYRIDVNDPTQMAC